MFVRDDVVGVFPAKSLDLTDDIGRQVELIHERVIDGIAEIIFRKASPNRSGHFL